MTSAASTPPAGRPRAAVVGLAGPELTPEEAELYRALPPAGFILFRRNCGNPDQLRSLASGLKALFPERWVPILIDQEGGRVQRLAPPAFAGWPAASKVCSLCLPGSPEGSLGVKGFAFGIGAELAAHGVDVNCAPVLDLRRPETTDAIGDRAFSADPILVAGYGLDFVKGLRRAGVAPVLKHLPGHGRATSDSHLSLPKVTASAAELRASDWLPFKRLAGESPFAMTAHLLFTALDKVHPATLSRKIIRDVIRGEIGFPGILFSDDLDMKALRGPVAKRAVACLEAGCDLALQCNGKIEDARAVLEAVPSMSEQTFAKLQASRPAPAPDIPNREALAALAARYNGLTVGNVVA